MEKDAQMKYKVYDKKDEFLGIINGKDEKDALKEAKAFDMDDAFRVELIDEKKVKVRNLKKEVLFN